MSEAITRCPKCQTSFKLKSEHLNSARGAVRCGSCLTIFNANENLIEVSKPNTGKKQPPVEPQANRQASNQEPAAGDKTADKDEALISDDMETNDSPAKSSLGFDENVFVASNASTKDLNLFERRIKAAEKDEQNRVQADESWAEQLLDDESFEDDIPKEDFEQRESSEPTRSIPTDTDPIFKIIEDEIEHEEAQIDQEIKTELIRESVFAEDPETDSYEPFEEDQIEEEQGEDFFHAFEAEPLEFTGPKNSVFWYSNTFWGSMSALLLILAAFQLSAFNIQSWGRSTTMRPYYETACSFLPCKLPTLIATDKIRIENMVVLDHPNKNNTLLVDATIINEASFEQVFPVLLLSFSDMQNSLIEQFQFSPRDYVGGELAGKHTMPAKHPIHINLEVPDPGTEAVNYRFSIVKK